MKKFIYIYIFFFIKSIFSLDNSNNHSEYFNEMRENIYDISISFEDKNEMEYNIDPKKPYIFSIKNENYRYSFSTDFEDENILFYYDSNNNLEPVSNDNFFELGEKIHIINKPKLTEPINIKVMSIPQYSTLNGFETINENQYFFIKAKEDSIAYFDSFDRNSKIYISNNTEKKITKDDEKINGKFIPIKPNITYFIKNELYENTISVFKKYLYPLNLTNEKIYIIDDNINYLYLKANHNYILNFEKNSKILAIMLSSKIDSEIEIKENENIKCLNKTNPYYGEIEKSNFNELVLNVKENDAFIEFLLALNIDEVQILEINDGEEDDLELDSDKNIITTDIYIGLTQDNIRLILSSNNEDSFNYSISLGPSKEINPDYKFIYASSSNSKIKSNGNKVDLELSALYKYFDPQDEEYLSFTIFIDKKENQNILISYELFHVFPKEIYNILYRLYDFEKFKGIKNIFEDLFNIYVYTDIAQNPPKIPGFTHEKINLNQKLNELYSRIEEDDSNESPIHLYELYHDLKQLTCLTKDLHFNFQLKELMLYKAFLPFTFVIKKYQNENRIFIEKNGNFDQFAEKEKEFIESHLDIPLKKINDIEPFEYIQNWSKFSSVKNIHAQFTFIIDKIQEFTLSEFPLYNLDLTSNEYEFDDNQILRMNYKIYYPKDDNEFDAYLKNIIQNIKFFQETPSLAEIKDNFLILKGQTPRLKNEEKLNWDFEIEDNTYNKEYLKCRVDTINKVNVIVQNSFNMDYLLSIRTILNCAKLFHSNDYPIIIIESKNKGGNPILAKIMIQVFQILTVERSYNSYSASYKDYIEETQSPLIDPESCKIIDSAQDLIEETDYYKYDDEEIAHKRTKRMQEINLQVRKALNNFREEFKNSLFLKKPTEILIFTDSFSFSSASTLIKGFQNIGGAIIVGYFGNPTKEGIDLFDSSQSDSSFYEINIDKEELIEIAKDFEISLTTQEIFDDYKDENPLPREYSFDKVDFRVDIYSKYSDDIYSQFIDEGKKILDKFKDGNYCNSKNEKMIIPDETCRNLGDHLHGGYKCKKEKDEWDKSKCFPYYCDIGYYFDKYEQKCVKECTYENEVYFLYENNYTNEFNIKNNEIYLFFTYNPEDYYYAFQSSSDNCFYIKELLINNEETFSKKPRIYFHKPENENDYMNISYCPNNTNVKIKAVKIAFDMWQLKASYFLLYTALVLRNKYIMIFEGYGDENILYINPVLNNKIKYAKFNDEMSYEDIININDTYFTDYTGDILTFEKDKIHILYFDNNNYQQNIIQFYLCKEEWDKDISLNIHNYLYLKKDNTYKLNNPNLNIMLKLSRKTLNSEIKTSDNIILDANNLYYNISKDNNEFQLSINKENAFIEVLYNFIDSYEDLEFEESEFNLLKEYNIIKIPKRNYTNKIINFEIIGNDKSEYLIYHDYTIFPYFHYYQNQETEKMNLTKCNFSIEEPYLESIKLMENEFYYVMIRKNKEELKLYIKIENKTEESEESEIEEESEMEEETEKEEDAQKEEEAPKEEESPIEEESKMEEEEAQKEEESPIEEESEMEEEEAQKEEESPIEEENEIEEESEIEEEEEKEKEGDQKEINTNKLSWWKITLIAISCVIFLIFIILLILYIRRKKHISSKSLEENLKGVGEIRELETN